MCIHLYILDVKCYDLKLDIICYVKLKANFLLALINFVAQRFYHIKQNMLLMPEESLCFGKKTIMDSLPCYKKKKIQNNELVRKPLWLTGPRWFTGHQTLVPPSCECDRVWLTEGRKTRLRLPEWWSGGIYCMDSCFGRGS